MLSILLHFASSKLSFWSLNFEGILYLLTLLLLNLKGAKRRLTYNDGTTFIETVVDIESDRIVLELSEYPWSCTKLYANLFTTKVDDGNSVFNVALMYNFTEDSDDTFKNWFINANQGMITGISENVKKVIETKTN
jgi:hypothetical protein